MSVRRSLLVLTLLTLLLPVAVFSLRANRPVPPQPSVQTYIVGRGGVEVTVSAVGTMNADRTTNLSFSTPGRVTEIAVEVGETVSEGQVLAQLASDAQQIALEQAQLALQLAQVQKERLLLGPTEAQLAVARANIESAQGAVSSVASSVSPNTLRAAELAYEQAQQALANAQQERAFGNGFEQQVQLLDAQVGAATFNAEIARLNLQSLQNSSTPQLNAAYARVAQAQAELARLEAGASQPDLDRADAAIAQAQVAVDRAQVALDRTRLVAPFAGIIAGVVGEVGGLVVPGMPLLQLADVTPMRLSVQVDELDVRQIATGLPASIRLDALPDTQLAATLESVALVPQNEGGIVSYEAVVRLDAVDPRVLMGMTAEASVVVDSRADVITIPNSYIRLDRQRGGAFVNLVRPDGTLLEVPVTLGLQGQESSEITSGLSEGDVIGVTLGADSIGLLGG